MSFISDFKAFAMRGNVIDLAVAVVIGAEFGKIVSSLVDGIIMPVIGWLSGGIDITGEMLSLGSVTLKWGEFLQSIINFTIISFAIFVAVRLIHAMYQKQDVVSKLPSEEVQLLREIRDLLKKA